MKTACVLLFVTLLGAASANRDLLQTLPTAPAPAPGPTSCPPKQSPAATCVTNAATFQGQCASFITALNSATGGQVTATSDDQITALVSKLTTKPTAGCCTAAQSLFRNACACDTTVQELAKNQQKLSPSQFQTVGKVFLLACGYPTCTDTCNLASA